MKQSRILLLLITAAVLLTGFKENNLENKINAAPRVSIANVSVVEGNQGQRTVEVMVIISEVTNPVTITYTTRNGTASAGSDYEAAKGSLDFADGQMMKKIAVLVKGDVDCEQDETFDIVLSDALGITSGNSIGTVTILNDDCLRGSKSAGGNNNKSNSVGNNNNNSVGNNNNNSNSAAGNSNSTSIGSNINANLSVYEVRLTFTGYTTFYGTAADCGIRPNGKVTLSGLLSGAEDTSSDDDIMYTGALQLDIDMDICSAKRLPNGEDRLCGITVLGCGPVKTELEVQFDQRGGYVKIEDESHEFIKMAVGNCDKSQIMEEQDMIPNKTIASIFNGTPLPMLTNRTLTVGRYVETGTSGEMVVEVLRKIR